MNGTRVDLETLIDWLDGRLPAADAEQVAAAVATGDPRTRATVRWLREFRDVAADFSLEQPPALVRQRLRHQFERRRDEVADQPVRRQARLVFDSRIDAAAAGVRAGGAGEDGVQLAYAAGDADLVLDVRPAGLDTVRLDGQLLLGEPAIVDATVTGPGGSVRSVDGDELGRFCLDGVPLPAHELSVATDRLVLVAVLDLDQT